ncbi:hypothetical protein BDV98DRAFT_338844 [Pterulicium gracile]|uniref:Hydrophobin n=1 Tax=Pterulicium gracile TaxID=1884261 RepID=A0A5C3Q3K7_9AGAR|nr:hypothetical protein BDV98DRAFT_338844 [Pterula gracilis]
MLPAFFALFSLIVIFIHSNHGMNSSCCFGRSESMCYPPLPSRFLSECDLFPFCSQARIILVHPLFILFIIHPMLLSSYHTFPSCPSVCSHLGSHDSLSAPHISTVARFILAHT